MTARTAVCYSEQQTTCLPHLGKDTYQQEEGDHKRETYLQKKQTNNQQYIEVKHVENYTSTLSKAREKTKNLKRTPNVSPDRRPFNHDELKKIKERYTFLGRHPNNPSKEKNKRNGRIDETTAKKIEKTDVVRRSGSSSTLRSPDERTRSKNSSKDSGISDCSPAIHHSPKQSNQSQNSSKDSGISGSTKTDIDLMKGIYSNDEDDEFVDAENYEIKTVETPPLRRKAIVRTINNDAKVYKAVTFEEQKRKAPLRINIPNNVRRKEAKKSSSKATVRDKSRQSHKKARCSSPRLESLYSRPGPDTEVAKWVPSSIDNHTKPYYEAWVNTKLAAVSTHTEQERAKLEEQNLLLALDQLLTDRPKSPDLIYIDMLDERFSGKITVRRRSRKNNNVYEIHRL